MMLTEREDQLGELFARAHEARAGRGGVVIVCGESGAGKTSFVEAFLERWSGDERVLWGVCDPLSTPRPLGPIHDLADQFEPAARDVLHNADHPYEIFTAVFEELRTEPSILVIDDLHWADQATVDLLRFVLRRISRTHSLVIGTVRDDELASAHSTRSLLGDVARSTTATSLPLPPLSVEAITVLSGDRAVDPVVLHRITGGNPFFVVEMLDHEASDDLPATVRDAILARTVDLDVPAWDLLYLLACAPGSIPDYLLAHLDVTVPALRTLDAAKLISRSDRGVSFRHDLCRLAVASVIPPGAEVDIHRRMIDAYEAASRADPAVLTHHAVGAGDRERTRQTAFEAGRIAARAGAHTQAADFYQIALSQTGPLPPQSRAELVELLADEYYLTDRLDDAIVARRQALGIREQLDEPVAVSANHHALAIYESYNTNLSTAERHAAQAVAALDGRIEHGSELEVALLGHALATQAYFAVTASDLTRAETLLSQARESAFEVDDPALAVRMEIIAGYRGGLAGDDDARDRIVTSIGLAAELFEDDIYSYGCSLLALLDIEKRRLDQAAEQLTISVPLSVERDAPFIRSWLLAMRARLELHVGDWDGAAVDSETVLTGPSTPLVRTWPLLVRALILLRRDGAGDDGIDDAWQVFCRFGEHFRLFPAAAIAERAWLTGTPDDRLDECRTLLDSCPVDGINMAIGDLAMWLHRLDPSVDAIRVEGPYRLLLDGEFDAAADEFRRLSMPYEAALALVDSGDADLARRGLDVLDRLGAAAVAAKVRRDLRAQGVAAVPARSRSTTLSNPAGLTARQIDVLRLLSDGLTNAELADRLYLSAKTIDHHVSAILTKLEVPGRREAVRRARELGILAQESSE